MLYHRKTVILEYGFIYENYATLKLLCVCFHVLESSTQNARWFFPFMVIFHRSYDRFNQNLLFSKTKYTYWAKEKKTIKKSS